MSSVKGSDHHEECWHRCEDEDCRCAEECWDHERCGDDDDDEFWVFFILLLVVLCLGCCVCACCIREANAKKQIHAVVIQKAQMMERQGQMMMDMQSQMVMAMQQQQQQQQQQQHSCRRVRAASQSGDCARRGSAAGPRAGGGGGAAAAPRDLLVAAHPRACAHDKIAAGHVWRSPRRRAPSFVCPARGHARGRRPRAVAGARGVVPPTTLLPNPSRTSLSASCGPSASPSKQATLPVVVVVAQPRGSRRRRRRRPRIKPHHRAKMGHSIPRRAAPRHAAACLFEGGPIGLAGKYLERCARWPAPVSRGGRGSG